MDNNYPPYVYLDSSGNLQGILIDQWKLWEQKTGIKVELFGMDWGEALSRMGNGEFDVIDTIFYNESRAQIYDFSRPYVRLDVPIFFSNQISGITNAESLKGFPVALKRGDSAIEFLKSKGVDQILEYNSYEEIIAAAKAQKVIVFVVDQPPALYYLYKFGIQGNFNHTDPLYTGEFHRAVRKGNTEILQTVERGFGLISSDEISAIDRKWVGVSQVDPILLRYVGIGGTVILISLFILVAWNYGLRRTVAHRTLDLKKAIDELSGSEQKYRQLVANLPGVVYRCANDADWSLIYLSHAVSEIFGYVPADFIAPPGRGLVSILFPPDREAAVQSVQKAIRETGKFSVDFRIVAANGDVCWVSNRGQAVVNNSGVVQWVDGVIFDITERKRSEEALRESEERLRSTIESMDDIIFVFDQDRRITNFYHSVDPNYPYHHPDPTSGKRLEEVDFPRDIANQFDRAFSLVQMTGISQSFVYFLNMPDGGHWYNARLSRRLDEWDQFNGVTAVISNITEQKLAEQGLHIREEEARGLSVLLAALTRVSMELSLAANTDDLLRTAVELGVSRLGFGRMGIWLIDPSDQKHIQGTFGIDETGQLRDERDQYLNVDTTIADSGLLDGKSPIVHFDDIELFDDRQRSVGKGEWAAASLWDGRVVNGYISGDNFFNHEPIDARHCEILMLFSQVIGHLFTLKKTEAAVRQLNEDLEQRVVERTAQLESSYREMQSFSYAISHDLRAPLRSLNSFSQILQDDYSNQLDDEAKDYLNRIRTSSRRMADLIDALQKLTRISHSEIQMELITLDPIAIEIIGTLQSSQPERRVEWIVATGLVCRADPVLMRVVLENLLGNAWKFSSHHLTARIELGRMEDHGKAAFFVRDDGAGFDMTYANKLFQSFQRLHAASEFEGTGIGLAIVQRIIQRHGGEIWAEGAPEHGATFYFTLPGES